MTTKKKSSARRVPHFKPGKELRRAAAKKQPQKKKVGASRFKAGKILKATRKRAPAKAALRRRYR